MKKIEMKHMDEENIGKGISIYDEKKILLRVSIENLSLKLSNKGIEGQAYGLWRSKKKAGKLEKRWDVFEFKFIENEGSLSAQRANLNVLSKCYIKLAKEDGQYLTFFGKHRNVENFVSGVVMITLLVSTVLYTFWSASSSSSDPEEGSLEPMLLLSFLVGWLVSYFIRKTRHWWNVELFNGVESWYSNSFNFNVPVKNPTEEEEMRSFIQQFEEIRKQLKSDAERRMRTE